MSKKQLDAQAIRLLQRAREILSDPQRWTQGTMARDANGMKTTVDPKILSDKIHGFGTPVCFCSIGAIKKATYDRIGEVKKLVSGADDEINEQYCTHLENLYSYLSNLAGRDLVSFNDDPDTQYADVVNLFDLAIDNCEERVYD